MIIAVQEFNLLVF